MKRLIECVPNFSEGRDAAKVDALVTAMSGVPGVYVLDREMDADHNRCVVTLAGEPDGSGSGAAWRRQSHGVDRLDETHRRTSPRGRDGRAALYSHRWGDHRRLRGASAAGGRRNLEAVPNTGFFLRSGGDAAGPRESGKC